MVAPEPAQFVTVEDEFGASPVLGLLGGEDAGGSDSVAVVRYAYAIRQKLKNRGFRWNPATRGWRRAYRSRSDLETLVRDAFSADVRHVERRSAAVVRQVAPDLFGR